MVVHPLSVILYLLNVIQISTFIKNVQIKCVTKKSIKYNNRATYWSKRHPFLLCDNNIIVMLSTQQRSDQVNLK
jgi:hypothetical protein